MDAKRLEQIIRKEEDARAQWGRPGAAESARRKIEEQRKNHWLTQQTPGMENDNGLPADPHRHVPKFPPSSRASRASPRSSGTDVSELRRRLAELEAENAELRAKAASRSSSKAGSRSTSKAASRSTSRAGSRSGSRAGSRSGSRAGSRASSRAGPPAPAQSKASSRPGTGIRKSGTKLISRVGSKQARPKAISEEGETAALAAAAAMKKTRGVTFDKAATAKLVARTLKAKKGGAAASPGSKTKAGGYDINKLTNAFKNNPSAFKFNLN